MPPYLSHLESWKSLWPLPLTALVLAVVFYLIVRPSKERQETLLLLAAFSMLGLVAGYLTGFSRAPAVGAVLPAVLSLVAGLAVFLVGRDGAAKLAVSLSVLIFSLGLVIGTTWGTVMRQTAEDYYLREDVLKERARVEAAVSETVLKQRALIEIEVEEFREALGLASVPAPEP